jgi:hypothetical protein
MIRAIAHQRSTLAASSVTWLALPVTVLLSLLATWRGTPPPTGSDTAAGVGFAAFATALTGAPVGWFLLVPAFAVTAVVAIVLGGQFAGRQGRATFTVLPNRGRMFAACLLVAGCYGLLLGLTGLAAAWAGARLAGVPLPTPDAAAGTAAWYLALTLAAALCCVAAVALVRRRWLGYLLALVAPVVIVPLLGRAVAGAGAPAVLAGARRHALGNWLVRARTQVADGTRHIAWLAGGSDGLPHASRVALAGLTLLVALLAALAAVRVARRQFR